MQCQVCKGSGSNMRRCKKCGQIYCRSCASKGKGPYPKVKDIQKCLWCGGLNCSEAAR